jgi:hypothetical protein
MSTLSRQRVLVMPRSRMVTPFSAIAVSGAQLSSVIGSPRIRWIVARRGDGTIALRRPRISAAGWWHSP